MYQVGIDVSKKKLDICLLTKGVEEKRKTKVIKNDQHSAKTLIEWLEKQKCLLEMDSSIARNSSIEIINQTSRGAFG